MLEDKLFDKSHMNGFGTFTYRDSGLEDSAR